MQLASAAMGGNGIQEASTQIIPHDVQSHTSGRTQQTHHTQQSQHTYGTHAADVAVVSSMGVMPQAGERHIGNNASDLSTNTVQLQAQKQAYISNKLLNMPVSSHENSEFQINGTSSQWMRKDSHHNSSKNSDAFGPLGIVSRNDAFSSSRESGGCAHILNGGGTGIGTGNGFNTREEEQKTELMNGNNNDSSFGAIQIIFILLISAIVLAVLEVKSREFGEFDHGFNVLNTECELEKSSLNNIEYCFGCGALTSHKIDRIGAPANTPVSWFKFGSTGVRLSDLTGVLPATVTTITNENDNKIKYENEATFFYFWCVFNSVILECKCDFENVNCDCDFYDLGHLCYGPRCLSPHPQPSRPTVWLFIQIIFGILLEYTFKYDMYEICGESLPPTPCHRPSLFNFINTRVESRERLVLKCIFNGICN